MLKIEKTSVSGWEAAIRGMRNAKNSWDKSDSYPAVDCGKCGIVDKEGICYPKEHNCKEFECFAVGSNDLKLMKILTQAGTDHRKFARYIDVTVDITAPLYFWKEFKTYRRDRKFVDDEDFYDYDDYDNELFIEMNSCSTMHKIHSKEFTLDDFSHEHLLDKNIFDAVTFQIASPLDVLHNDINMLNACRQLFLETQDKIYWWQMIQLLPSSYNQLRTVKFTYEVLMRMYKSRKNHKLDEWHTFCDWILSLPYFKEICLED